MHLYLIRHAQSANNELYTRTGNSDGRSDDPPLTELGHKQAELLAQFLASPLLEPDVDQMDLSELYLVRHNRQGFGLTHLYCSLMTRSIQTGQYIAAATGLPLVGWMDVHERGGIHNIDEESGEDAGLPGPNRAALMAKYPDLILPDSLGEAGWWNERPPETTTEALARADGVWAELLERHGPTDDRIAIVSHFGFFQSLLTTILYPGEGREETLTVANRMLLFGMSNASISRFEIGEGFFVVRYLNRVDFLPDELVSG